MKVINLIPKFFKNFQFFKVSKKKVIKKEILGVFKHYLDKLDSLITNMTMKIEANDIFKVKTQKKPHFSRWNRSSQTKAKAR